MRSLLTILFSAILIAMILVTTRASLDRSIFNVGQQLLYDRWFQATLCDAYFGFLTFYVWVWYRESNNILRILWLLLIMVLGNIAISIYVLIQLWLLPQNAALGDLMKKRAIASECD